MLTNAEACVCCWKKGSATVFGLAYWTGVGCGGPGDGGGGAVLQVMAVVERRELHIIVRFVVLVAAVAVVEGVIVT